MSALGTSATREAAVDEARDALGRLLGAERRLRGRDQHRHEGLTHAQLRALAALRGGPLPAGRLARAADVNPASVTAMVDQLESAGVLERRRRAEDRRVTEISLTEQGRELLEAKRARYHAVWAEHLADVEDGDLRTAARVMRAIAEMLDVV
ncbi:MAG TPA: MarR family transcriptional regulator [Solirubrobacteraceae bacterium]